MYEEAEITGTVARLAGGDPEGAGGISGQEVVNVPVTVPTHAFGEISANLALPVDGDEVAWRPHLVFPGLAPGEELDRNVEVPERAPILARDRTPLAEGDGAARSSPVGGATLYVAGELGAPKGEQAVAVQRRGFPAGSLVGTSGLELAFETRLAGQPGGELMAVGGQGGTEAERVLRAAEPVEGEPMRTTINPDIQEAAAAALGNTFGGVAVLDAKNGNVLGLAGIAFSSPQPPGSTFKVMTTVAALEAGVVKLNDTFPVETSTIVGGREISNAHDEPCGGTFTQSFARSCNTVFAPLGAEIGNDRLVNTSERFGFNSPPTLYDAEATAITDPARARSRARSGPISTSG